MIGGEIHQQAGHRVEPRHPAREREREGGGERGERGRERERRFYNIIAVVAVIIALSPCIHGGVLDGSVVVVTELYCLLRLALNLVKPVWRTIFESGNYNNNNYYYEGNSNLLP